ncbi:phage tail fiber protein [Enterobacter kobei]|uniref:phage tail fiber domain-containing protein n=1 Tax=Enterobacter kobei TaxID=208224 RepID=UPI0009CCDF8F|nr:phage tail fiber protein [Enterobacter kobei]OOV75044.1 hypothetical protein B1742_10015 [Enterobacter kobei]
MSVPNQTPYIIYNANGLTTVFPFEFYIINANDIQVTINGDVVTSGYSVSGVGNVGGGDVIFLTPPASGSVVMLERVVPTYRLTDYQDNGDLLADTVNKDFDRLWMAIQRSFIYLGLALRRPLLGGPFNAEGYRIANGADPVEQHDFATKNYVDNVAANSADIINQKIDANFSRTLRVPELSVDMLAPAGYRANKIFAWDSFGRPINIPAPSGSAADVFIELAKSTGAGLIGAGMTTVDNLLVKFSPLRYGAKADGSNDTAAFTSCMAAMPSGATMDLQGLTYSVTDIEVTKPMRIINGTINVLYGALKGGVYAHDTSNVHVQNVTTIVDYANKTSYTSANVSGIHFENCTDISAVNCTAIGSKNDNYLATGSWGCPIHAYQCTRVSFQNCVIKKGDKEGLMTRFCDEVWMDNCRGYECGQSCIGTSGGNRAIINACYSDKAGNTGISMNSQNSIVTNCVVEANLQFHGILIGHSHETGAYARECLIANNVVINAASNGIAVTYPSVCTISGNSIRDCGGNGIFIDRPVDVNSVITVIGNTISSSAGCGIYHFGFNDDSVYSNVNIAGNNIYGSTLYGIRASDNGYIKISGNMIRGVSSGPGIFCQRGTSSTSSTIRGKYLGITDNSILNVSASSINSMGFEYVDISNNKGSAINSSSSVFGTFIKHDANAVYWKLPGFMNISGNAFSGIVGASSPAAIAIADDTVTTGGTLIIRGNHIDDTTKTPLSYPTTRFGLKFVGNTRGADPTLIGGIVLPASGSVVVTNSNITPFSLPLVTARGNSGFYVSTFALGTITINNTGTNSMQLNVSF